MCTQYPHPSRGTKLSSRSVPVNEHNTTHVQYTYLCIKHACGAIAQKVFTVVVVVVVGQQVAGAAAAAAGSRTFKASAAPRDLLSLRPSVVLSSAAAAAAAGLLSAQQHVPEYAPELATAFGQPCGPKPRAMTNGPTRTRPNECPNTRTTIACVYVTQPAPYSLALAHN